jgi:hypothetical protein
MSVRDWFARSQPPLRTALGLALGFHGMTDEAVEQVILDGACRSIRWAIRRGRRIAFVPNDAPFPRPAQEPYVNSPVFDAIGVAERLRARGEEQASDFAPVFRFPMTLMESGGHLIGWPG